MTRPSRLGHLEGTEVLHYFVWIAIRAAIAGRQMRYWLTRTRGFLKRKRHAIAASLVAFALPAFAAAPLFEGLESASIGRASSVVLAQRYFAQGSVLAWGFNPQEAARSFEAAIALDTRCALCYWGLAWSLGPNVNTDMDASDAVRVRDALAKAAPQRARDRALIEALRARHPAGDAIDEEAYADRMRALARRYPRDADIATLAAEALLNLHPYDWWHAGEARPWTGEIRALLARALQLDPRHPGANHYSVHLAELSPRPADAIASADRLASLVPGSGHLMHMPAHIYMRVGRYDDAIAASKRAIAADARYLAEVDAQRAYRVGYAAHNHHFLWAAAAMQGRGDEALAAARAALPVACGPGRSDRRSGVLQQYFVLPYFTLVRFGRWREILDETLPPDVGEAYPLAIWHYARGTAFAHTGRIEEAKRELATIDRLAPDVRERIKNVNSAQSLVRIAQLTLGADILAFEGRGGDAVALLAQATAIEDDLAYDEPHLWLAPTRHALGAALVTAGRYPEAERVYREDLAHYPGNGWSLRGLAKAQRLRGDVEAAAATERAFRQAWHVR